MFNVLLLDGALKCELWVFTRNKKYQTSNDRVKEFLHRTFYIKEKVSMVAISLSSTLIREVKVTEELNFAHIGPPRVSYCDWLGVTEQKCDNI